MKENKYINKKKNIYNVVYIMYARCVMLFRNWKCKSRTTKNNYVISNKSKQNYDLKIYLAKFQNVEKLKFLLRNFAS